MSKKPYRAAVPFPFYLSTEGQVCIGVGARPGVDMGELLRWYVEDAYKKGWYLDKEFLITTEQVESVHTHLELLESRLERIENLLARLINGVSSI